MGAARGAEQNTTAEPKLQSKRLAQQKEDHDQAPQKIILLKLKSVQTIFNKFINPELYKPKSSKSHAISSRTVMSERCVFRVKSLSLIRSTRVNH